MFQNALLIVLKFAARLKGLDLSKLFENAAMLSAVAQMVYEKFFKGREIGDGTLLRDLLREIWENKEEILEFVLMILRLFGVLADDEIVPTVGIASAEIEADFNALCDALST